MIRSGNGLYSPAATSDSSGFSEQHRGGGSDLSYTTFNPALYRPPRPTLPSFDRSLSPQVPHSYHNPTLMASPYSTLPRRPTQRSGPPPIMASAVGRNSPLLELTGVSNNRSSSLGRNSSLFAAAANTDKKSSPLMDDDRESCV